ncbi:hypothetical protein [Arthrobacter sp. GMC3]|uniref:hypothetical protein n=1 Tax=Arthrobacter sp. GMC3 TaxID=2058894 RepID=UPI0011B03EFE|nr:hypothetical protein [Arthrobacter sp. GMC3]
MAPATKMNRMIKTMPVARIHAACEALGFDPATITGINMGSASVSVTEIVREDGQRFTKTTTYMINRTKKD